MATQPKKVKYVGPGGQERFVREGDVQADTAARFDGFLPETPAAKPKAKPSARRAAKPKVAPKQAPTATQSA